MDKKSLSVLLIEKSPEYAEQVKRWFSAKSGAKFSVNWTTSLRAGLNGLAQGGIDVILLALGKPDKRELETFATTKVHATGVPIIVLGGSENEAHALVMVERGAQDYLVKSACTADTLIRAIQYAVVRFSSQGGKSGAEPVPEPTRVIGIMGAKGGVGASTIACSLAADLSRQTQKKTLLVDLDVNAGIVGFLMNMETQYSVLDAASNIHRLDLPFWESIVTRGPNDLHILRSPALLGSEAPDLKAISHALTFIRCFYRWIVLDLGRLNGFSVHVLENISELILVTSARAPELFETKRAVAALNKAGIDSDRLRVVVNHVAKKHGLPEGELRKLLNLPVYAGLPAAGQELHDACMQRKLPAATGEFGASVAALTRKLAGLPEIKAKRKLSQLFSFGERFRPIEPETPSTVPAR